MSSGAVCRARFVIGDLVVFRDLLWKVDGITHHDYCVRHAYKLIRKGECLYEIPDWQCNPIRDLRDVDERS
jgi:hypothetical protein